MNELSNIASPLVSTVLYLSELAHQIQLERGCTALYLDSEGALFHEEWASQCKNTDQAARDVTQHSLKAAKLGHLDQKIVRKIQDTLRHIEALGAHRKNIDQQAIGFAKAVNHYTYTLLSPILDIEVETALHIEGVDPIKVTAFSNLLQWKERVGRERAWGAHGFCSDVFKTREFCERMLTLIEEQNAYKRLFLSLASEQHQQFVETMVSGYVMECVDELHKMLAQDPPGALDRLSPITWFELLTGKVERLKLVETKLVQDLEVGATEPAKPSIAPATVSARLEKHMSIIRALPVFSKLEETSLVALLSHADIREVKKGKLLFLQSELLSRFYVILSGWVKLFKGTDAGDEAVLQMLCAGDSIMEAAVFLNIPSPTGAQVAEDTVLLSLPAPVVRQVLQKNNVFALNIIGNLSLRSQGLIRQIEHSRLRNASERVGWFLLKLALEEGSGQAATIQLPYDKSLIASYLDMTPETFSRTLNKFRDQGFRIEDNTVSHPNSKALCPYCDQTLATACIYKDTSGCPATYL